MFLRNTGNLVSDHMALHSRRLHLSLQVMLVSTPSLIFCVHLLTFIAIQGQSLHRFYFRSEYLAACFDPTYGSSSAVHKKNK